MVYYFKLQRKEIMSDERDHIIKELKEELKHYEEEFKNYEKDILITTLKSQIENLFQAIDNYKKLNEETVFIISSIAFDPNSIHTFIDSNSLESFYDLNNKINFTLKIKCIERENVFVLDINRLIEYHGHSFMYDIKYWVTICNKYLILGYNLRITLCGCMIICGRRHGRSH